MRNIKDLKPNESIKISTKKEAKYFKKEMGSTTEPKKLIGKYIMLSKDGLGWCEISSGKVIPASDFLPKKAKLKNVVANLEARVKVLEKGSDFMQEINNIETEALLFEPTQPLTELPENWCVKVNSENKKMMHEYKKNVSEGVYAMEAAIFPYIKHDGCGCSVIDDYTEISTEDFKRLVLKENVLEDNVWYVYKSGALMFNIKDGKGYGISSNKEWCEPTEWLNYTDNGEFTPAFKDQIEIALINEANKRGFKHNIEIKSNGLNVYLSEHNGLFQLSGNTLWYGGYIIFNNGIWAEIIEPAKEGIDWSKPGQLVHIENSKGIKIVVTSGDYDRRCFSGTTIKNTLYDRGIGGCSDEWVKYRFEIYTGEPVTLSN